MNIVRTTDLTETRFARRRAVKPYHRAGNQSRQFLTLNAGGLIIAQFANSIAYKVPSVRGILP